MRSGSSMMMRALIAGGMDAFYDPERDKKNNDDTEYQGRRYIVNPGGYYEMSHEFYNKNELAYLSQRARGKLIKFLIPGLLEISVPNDIKLKILIMTRNPDEIAKSWEVAFQGKVLPESFGFDVERYDSMMDGTVKFLEAERNADVIPVSYHDVLKNPKKEFRLIRDDDWPIQPVQSAKVIDKSLHRIKREDLNTK